MSSHHAMHRIFARLRTIAAHLSANVALATGFATLGNATTTSTSETAFQVPSVTNVRIRKYSAKYVLKRANGALLRLTGHRSHASHSSHASHASHSSHASHYSGSTGYVPPPPPAPAPAPVPPPRAVQPPPVSQKPRWHDSFDDDFVAHPRWRIMTPLDSPDTLITVLRRHARLEITPRAHRSGRHFNGYTTEPLDFRNAAVQVELVQAASHGAETLFAVAADAINWYGFRVHGQTLYCEAHVGGARRSHAVAFNSYSDRFLRIVHEEALNVIAWQTSSDGIRWTTQCSEAAGLPLSSLSGVLSAGTRSAVASPGMAVFDNFEYGPHE